MDKSCSLRCTAFYRIGNPFVIPYMIFIFENILAVHNEKQVCHKKRRIGALVWIVTN